MANSKGGGESEMGGSVFATNLTPKNQEEEEYHTDPEEADQVNNSHSREEAPGEITFGEAAGGSRWRVMTNPIMMDKIANLLSDKDLVALCLTSKTTKKIVDQMDSSCWRRRAYKLEAVLRLGATVTTDTTSYKERYLILKSEVERLANKLRAKIEDNLGRISVSVISQDSKHFSLQELASTASLIHHGMLGEVSCKMLCLVDVNLSSIPIQHLGSLAACVTDVVFFGVNENVIPDLGVFLDKVKCDKLLFLGQSLGTDETLALVRAMQEVRIVVLLLGTRGTVDVKALRNFDGKGRCEQVWMVKGKGDSIENTEDMRKLAKTIDWGVTEIDGSIIIHRGELEDDEEDYEYDEDDEDADV